MAACDTRPDGVNPSPGLNTAILARSAALQEALGMSGPDVCLNVTVVYEDRFTREWAGEVCDRVTRLVGRESIRATWWRLSDLGDPAVLAGAVSVAMRAEVLVVAVHAADVLPLPFYVWMESWLPHHGQKSAALVALVTMPGRPCVRLEKAREYLQAAAREARMDFIFEERMLPREGASAGEESAGQAGSNVAPQPDAVAE